MAPLLGTSSMTVERYSAAFVAGEFTRTLVERFRIRASRQDVNGRDRQALPELYRTRRVQWLGCQPGVVLNPTRVQGSQDGSPVPSDIVIDDMGRRHEVVTFQDWRRHNASTRHTAYFIAEIGEDGSI